MRKHASRTKSSKGTPRAVMVRLWLFRSVNWDSPERAASRQCWGRREFGTSQPAYFCEGRNESCRSDEGTGITALQPCRFSKP